MLVNYKCFSFFSIKDERNVVKEKVELYYFNDMFYIFSLSLYLHPNEPEMLTFFFPIPSIYLEEIDM